MCGRLLWLMALSACWVTTGYAWSKLILPQQCRIKELNCHVLALEDNFHHGICYTDHPSKLSVRI
jgi:hypothetical protein